MIRRTHISAALRFDRTLMLGLIAVMTALAWAYMVRASATMQGGPMDVWGASEFVLTFAMWSVMMVAMMLPSAAPMVVTFSSVCRRRGGRPWQRTALFVAGYLTVWTFYSLCPTGAQWALHAVAMTIPQSHTAGPYVGGGVLAAAGIFQLTPIKHACLRRCRSPIGFLMTEWRTGRLGAWLVGLRHGRFCVGCCWALMSVMFVVGTMNLLWMVALAVFCAAEKIAPRGVWIGRAGGLVLAGWGAWTISASLGWI